MQYTLFWNEPFSLWSNYFCLKLVGLSFVIRRNENNDREFRSILEPLRNAVFLSETSATLFLNIFS